MSDDQSPEPAPTSTPERPKKKKRPVESASARPIARAPVVASTPPSQWSTGHLAAALIVGLGLGGAGGYLGSRDSTPSATAESSAKAGQPAQSGQQQPAAANKQQQPPAKGAYVPIAAWTPREGPENAKVTILEFSDFQ